MRTPYIQTLKGDAYFLSAACIWGFTFIAQKNAMDGMGPFTYTGLRFLIGGFFLAILLAVRFYIKPKPKHKYRKGFGYTGNYFRRILFLGFFLYLGINLQQVGLIYTTPTNSAMITSLYVLLVPVILFLSGKYISGHIWVAGAMATLALYLLMVPDLTFDFYAINQGDLYSLVCSIFWAVHIIYLEKTLNAGADPLLLATLQSILCGALSLLTATAFENIEWEQLQFYFYELLFGGLFSIAIGFSFQIQGQRLAPASHASVLLGMEGMFASIADYIYLDTKLTITSYIGIVLMILAGMMVQFQLIWNYLRKKWFCSGR